MPIPKKHAPKTAWKQGQSGNPRGRKPNHMSFAKLVRRRVDPNLLIDVALSIATGKELSFDEHETIASRDGVQVLNGEIKAPTGADRMRALEFLRDSGWGKPLDAVKMKALESEGAIEPSTIDITQLTDEELDLAEQLARKMAVKNVDN